MRRKLRLSEKQYSGGVAILQTFAAYHIIAAIDLLWDVHPLLPAIVPLTAVFVYSIYKGVFSR